MTLGAVTFHRISSNRKLSPVDLVPVDNGTTFKVRPTPRAPYVSSTYVSIQATCPKACPFKRDHNGANGCFVDSGFTKVSSMRMDEQAGRASPEEVITEEVKEIDRHFPFGVPQDGARGGRDLRLHVGGDVGSVTGAKMLAAAATRWRLRKGGTVWTYTHDWRRVPRKAWGNAISVLASVENTSEIAQARRAGYAPAIVVEKFKSDRAWMFRGNRFIPCPAETRGSNCAECRLCLDRDLFAMRAVIVFQLHGGGAGKAAKALEGARRHLPVIREAA